MLFLNEIPHLKIYRQKTYLPLDKTKRTHNSVILLNSNSLVGSNKIMNYPFTDNSKFISYYLDAIYRGKLGNRQYRKNIKKERLDIYKQIQEMNVRTVNTYVNPSIIKNRNLYYDLYMYNNIFFQNVPNVNIRKRINMYIDFINSTIKNETIQNYPIKTMLINISEWNIDLKTTKGLKAFNNPITIILYSMLKMFDVFKSLGDINIIFLADNKVIRLNPSLCQEKTSYRLFKQELIKISKNLVFEDDMEIEKEIDKEEVVNVITNNFVERYNLIGVKPVDEKSDENVDINAEINEIVNSEEIFTEEDTLDEQKLEKLDESIKEKLEKNKEIMKSLDKQVKHQNQGRTTMSLKRDEELREKQQNITLDGKKISDIVATAIPEVPAREVSKAVKTTNQNLKKVKFANFEKEYNKTMMTKDIVNTFAELSKNSLPMFIIDADIQDSSDELNYKDTYTIKLEDSNRQRHTIKIDVPKFIDDKFMYLGGNKKVIIKQQVMKPIVKTGPDTIQIVTNYNKMFIRRYGQNVSKPVQQIQKYLSTGNLKGVTVKAGDSTKINLKYKTALEYDYLAKCYSEISTNKVRFIFNQDSLYEEMDKKKIDRNIPKDCWMIIGLTSEDKPIYLNNDQLVQGTNNQLLDFIVKTIDDANPGAMKDILSTVTGKRFMYTRAKSMKKEVPLIILLGFFQGLSKTLRRSEIPHYFTDVNPYSSLTTKQDVIAFRNGYLVYDVYPIENSLLLNGLSIIDTKAFDYEDFDDRETYMLIFDEVYGTRSTGKYFLNVLESMIDPITKEILETLNYPTNLCDLLVYANRMLTDNSFISEINMNLYRVRSNEIIPAMLYKIIADEYNNYRNVSLTAKGRKMSVKQDALLKQVLTSQIIEDYSTLNPVVEMEKTHAITPKGPSGLNVSEAYTLEKRCYDKSMLGIIAISTSPDANVGVVRSLSMEPKIKNVRGFVDINEDNLDNITDANMFSPAEMFTPISASRDDANRVAMSSKQSKHMIPIKNGCPVLMSNGAEQIIHYHIGDDFSVTADEDGEVIDIDEKNKLLIVKYKSGKNKAIDISTKIVKNGAGGFYLPNQLHCNLKVGDKFKKDDVIAYHDKFFTDDKINGNRFNIGSLQKIAIYSLGETFEDSSFITQKCAHDISSEIVMKKPVTLEKNSRIDKIVKIGDKIKSGEELMVFETSYEEDYMNQLLANVGEDLGEEIKSIGKKPIISKYTGEIVDIQIYHTVDLEELSPSLQKLVTSHNRQINNRKKILEKYANADENSPIYKCGMLFTAPSSKVIPKDGKIKGEYVGEGVLIEFYIKYYDIAGIADKFVNFCALKGIIGDVVPEHEEPFSEFRPDEEVATFLPPGSVLGRMTPSIMVTMFGNKVLVELKRKLEEIYNS